MADTDKGPKVYRGWNIVFKVTDPLTGKTTIIENAFKALELQDAYNLAAERARIEVDDRT